MTLHRQSVLDNLLQQHCLIEEQEFYVLEDAGLVMRPWLQIVYNRTFATPQKALFNGREQCLGGCRMKLQGREAKLHHRGFCTISEGSQNIYFPHVRDGGVAFEYSSLHLWRWTGGVVLGCDPLPLAVYLSLLEP